MVTVVMRFLPHHDVAERRQRAGEAVGLKFARADALPQDGGALFDRRKLRRIEIKRRLRERGDRNRLDLDIADVADRPAGGNRRADDDRRSPADRARRPMITLPTLRPRRLDAADQLVELGRGIADIAREAADDLERLLGLPDFEKLADKILVFLQGLQQTGELRPRVVKLLGRAFGLSLAACATGRSDIAALPA